MKFVKVGGRYINLDKVTEIYANKVEGSYVICFWLLDEREITSKITFKTKEEANNYIEKILKDIELREAYNEVSREGVRWEVLEKF